MNLLIVTQSVDREDPILGFFHRWLEEFATHAVRITVIANAAGTYTLPANVEVHSLGKESGRGRIGRIATYLSLLFRLKGRYDTVLVHMTPEHLLLGGPVFSLLGKPAFLWYNHPHAGLSLRLAAPFAKRIFYTSPESATASYSSALRMPVGIDTALFAPSRTERDPFLIYMQGRVMPSKRLEIALGALRALRGKRIPATLRIVGPADDAYRARLLAEYQDLFGSSSAGFAGPLPQDETPDEYRKAAVSVNLAREGHFDKSALEAMACETPLIAGSKTFRGLLPDEWIIENPDAAGLAATLERFFALSAAEREALGAELRARVVRTHSLAALAEKLFAVLSEATL